MKALPFACTLGSDDLRERLGLISALTKEALTGYERRDLILDLRFRSEAAERVRAMVAGEQRCCAFLEFAVEETPDSLRVLITAPEEARAAADELFPEFIVVRQ